MSKDCEHDWRPTGSAIESNPDTGLTINIYCYNCGIASVARLTIMGAQG